MDVFETKLAPLDYVFADMQDEFRVSNSQPSDYEFCTVFTTGLRKGNASYGTTPSQIELIVINISLVTVIYI